MRGPRGTTQHRPKSAIPVRVLPRFLYTREEAAAILGMSLSHFQRHVQPHLKCVYSGQLRLYQPKELERFTEEEAREAAQAQVGTR